MLSLILPGGKSIMLWKIFIEIGFFIGLLANALLFIPQAIKLYRLKRAEEVSFITFFGFNLIQTFTAIHAYIVHDVLLLVGSVLAIITCGTVTYFAFIYRLR